MSSSTPNIILCNGASRPSNLSPHKKEILLEYDPESPNINVNIPLPKLVGKVYHIDDRIKDLLEIASYIFAADRMVKRGTTSQVEYQSWSRSFHFAVKVRDFEFWNQGIVKNKLQEALVFMTGDKSYEFTFQKGHSTPKRGFFDEKEFQFKPQNANSVLLFSGGLDSLAGVIDRLETTQDDVFLISHVSQSGTGKTQKQLFNAIDSFYPNRCEHYKFKSNLKGNSAQEETQRTRSFLYSSIAFAIASSFSQKRFFFYENGITSINFSKREDLINARASRTTHPKTLGLLSELFTLINESEITIEHPFMLMTKTDVLSLISKYGKANLINSTVSCSKTRFKLQNSTHCGGCSQCVDRRFAAYASSLEEKDGTAIYDHDFINKKITDRSIKTTVVDYVRMALELRKMNYHTFCGDKLAELAELEEFIDGKDEDEKIDSIYKLCIKHGEQVEHAISRMNRPFDEIVSGSFLDIVKEREYLKEPVKNLALKIYEKLNNSLPIAFKKNKPANENDLNDKINAILKGEEDNYEREFPYVSFALAKTVPDHSIGYRLFIETKYIRTNTTPSVITDGIGSDLIKYPETSHKLFLIYDPEGQIADREKFISDFESRDNCTVRIIK